MESKLMKTTHKVLSVGIASAATVIVIFLVIVIARPALSNSTFLALVAPASTATPLIGEVIPLKPIADLSSLNATVKLDVNGLINGERAQGDLNVDLTTNDQGKSRISVTGPLLGELAAQVGGSLVGLFTPKSVDIYQVPKGTYVVVNGLFPMCIKPQESKATAALEEMSPQRLLGMLTSSDVARGKLVGQEKLNGVPVNHYAINGDAFLSAAQNSSDPKLKAFSKALWSAKDADLYVDAKSGTPLAFLGGFSGQYEPLKFEGDFDVQIELTGVNTNTPVNLPAACNKPITP
jgi:hypothetical protein